MSTQHGFTNRMKILLLLFLVLAAFPSHVVAAQDLTATPVVLVPWPTETPAPDGSIVHVVRAGETLWSIAVNYGVTVNQILTLNHMPALSTIIYVGEKLLIVQGSPITITPTATISMTPSATLRVPTQTLSPAAMTPTPTVTASPSQLPPTIPASQPAAFSDYNIRRIIGIILVVTCVVGLVLLFMPRFWVKK